MNVTHTSKHSSFVYIKPEHAYADIKRFSTSNMFENKSLYLILMPDGKHFIHTLPEATDNIVAIARNGKMFLKNQEQE